jgi:tetratricopeptide (TPR) repeat protein
MNSPSPAANNQANAPQGGAISIPEVISQAYAHWNAGQADQAEILCQRILAAWPGQTDALHLLGLIAHAFQHHDLAIGYLRKACDAPRAPALYLSNLAEMLRQKGNLPEAESMGRRALQVDNTLPAVWNNLGIVLQESGKLEEAKYCLEKLLTLEPNNSRAHNNLANTLKLLGNLNGAKMHWLKALEIDPQYPDPYSNLASLLGQMSQYDDAINYGKKAIELNPHLADAYLNIAAIETMRNRHLEALRWLESLLHFSPNHINGLSAKALSLMHLDQHEQALSCVNIAVGIAPNNAEAINAQGFILQALGRLPEAAQAFKTAASLPGLINEKALTNLALLHMQNGDIELASKAFDDLLLTYPNSANAWFNQSDLKTFAPGDPGIEKMELLLRSIDNPSDNDKMLLHFALGKACLDSGDQKNAFAHLESGNKMKRSTFTFDAPVTAKWLEKIQKVFTKQYIEEGRSKAIATALDAPIFIIGMPRSGTTLIEQILASHPMVQGAGELKHVQRIADGLGTYPEINPPLNSATAEKLGAEYIIRITRDAHGKAFVVDKMPANFLHVGLIHMMLPNARIVHCRRNPVDTCLSLYSKLFGDEQLFAYDLSELGIFYKSYESLMDHWRKVIPATHFYDVDYESVVSDLEPQAQQLLQFLNLPWDPACLNFHQTKRMVKTASATQVRQPIYKTSVDRWKKYENELSPLLEALGYPSKTAEITEKKVIKKPVRKTIKKADVNSAKKK